MTDIKQELPWYPSCFPGLQSVVGSNPTEGSSSFKKGAVLGVVDLFVVHLPFSLPHFSHMYITAEEESYLFISYKMVFLVLAPALFLYIIVWGWGCYLWEFNHIRVGSKLS